MYENHGLNVIFCRHNCFCISCLHQAPENSYKICVRVCVSCVSCLFVSLWHFSMHAIFQLMMSWNLKPWWLMSQRYVPWNVSRDVECVFLNLDASHQNNKKRSKNKASHIFTIFFQEIECSTFVTDPSVAKKSFFSRLLRRRTNLWPTKKMRWKFSTFSGWDWFWLWSHIVRNFSWVKQILVDFGKWFETKRDIFI